MVPATCTRSASRLCQLSTEIAPTPALRSWQKLTRPAHRNCCGSATALSSVRMRVSMTPRPSRLGLRRRAARTSTPGRSEAEGGARLVIFSRCAEEKRPVSLFLAPLCGVAEASLLLLATSLPRHCLGEWQYVSSPLEKYEDVHYSGTAHIVTRRTHGRHTTHPTPARTASSAHGAHGPVALSTALTRSTRGQRYILSILSR